MKRKLVIINSVGAIIILAYLALLGVNAFKSGYPWSVLCYNCKRCNPVCVLGIDPQGFIAAAYSSDPNVYIYTTNVRLKMHDAMDIDPGMEIIANGEKTTPAAALGKKGLDPDMEVISYRVRARDAAVFCLDCGACEKACPLSLPISTIARDLKKDGVFRGK